MRVPCVLGLLAVLNVLLPPCVVQQIVEDPLMRHSAILVFANKQDLKNALSPAETCEALGLPQMKGRKWHVQVGRAVGGWGTGHEGWLLQPGNQQWSVCYVVRCVVDHAGWVLRVAGRHCHPRRGLV